MNRSSLSLIGSFAHLFENNLVWHATDSSMFNPSRISSSISSTVFPTALSERKAFPQYFPSHLIKSGAVHEWFTHSSQAYPSQVKFSQRKAAKGKTSNEKYIPPLTLIAQLISQVANTSELQNRYILWIGEEIWPTPYLLSSHLLSSPLLSSSDSRLSLLKRSLFIRTPDEKLKLWAIDTALQSQGVAAVIAHCKTLRFALSQRFSLAAKNNNSLGMLLRPFSERIVPSSASGRWLVAPYVHSQKRSPTWQVELLKFKGALPEKRSWVLSEDWVLAGDMNYESNTSGHSKQGSTPQEDPLRVLSASVFATRGIAAQSFGVASQDQFQIAL